MSNWIEGAIKHPGGLRKKAAAAGGMKDGKITDAYLKSHDKGDSQTAKQARLAETLKKMRKNG